VDASAPAFDTNFLFALLYELVAAERDDEAGALAPALHRIDPELAGFFVWFADRYEESGESRHEAFRSTCLEAARLLDPENPRFSGR
jgi:hypothetical protein